MEMEKRQGKLWNTEKENESEKESEEASKRIKKWNLSLFSNCWDRQNVSGECLKGNMIDAHVTSLKSLKRYCTGGQDVQQTVLLIFKHLYIR